jgi:hypothetical protein
LQLRFLELLEIAETRDRLFTDPDGSWGSCVVKPNGPGWRVRDFNRERHTTWERRRLIVRNPGRRERRQ